MLVFGDFSTDLRDRYSTSEEWEELREIGLSSIFDPKPESYTRSQIYLSMLKSSYLDYFLVKGLSHTNFSIQGNLGSSDNCRLAIDITNLTPLKNKVEPDMISSQPRKHVAQIRSLIISKCAQEATTGIEAALDGANK